MNVPKAIERAGERVLTTAQIAEAYGADAATVKENFHRNKDRYVEGKHYYLLTGEPLRKFKRDVTNCNIAIPKNVNRYYLWTERGALLHAKSLNTDKAWEVYDFLVENYFRKKDILPKLPACRAAEAPHAGAVRAEADRRAACGSPLQAGAACHGRSKARRAESRCRI